MPNYPLIKLEAPSGLDIYHRGPPLEQGPLPSFFYFALSGEESLMQDPFNQPIVPLFDYSIRVFSFTLPLHEGPEYQPAHTVTLWAKRLAEEPQFIDNFISHCVNNIEYLIHEGLVDKNHVAAGGLSRGGFIASHVAAKTPIVQHIVGFAPMTKMRALDESIAGVETTSRLDLENLTDRLWDRKMRFYIGNRDILVQTGYCYQFVEKLANAAFEKGIRSAPFGLIIGPSIGHKGHGTAPETFADGAQWIANQLCKTSSFH